MSEQLWRVVELFFWVLLGIWGTLMLIKLYAYNPRDLVPLIVAYVIFESVKNATIVLTQDHKATIDEPKNI